MNPVITRLGADILQSDRFRRGETIPHHGEISVAAHSIAVAEVAYAWTRTLGRLGIRVSDTDVVRSALLHDIGMTERQVHAQIPARKCFLHPKAGARIAAQEYRANRVQYQAIRRHMWPAGFLPPTHLAGWIVWAADNHCAIRELRKKLKQTAARDTAA